MATPYDKDPLYYFTKVYDDRTVKKESLIDYRKREPLGIDIDIFPIDTQPPKGEEKEFYKNSAKRKKLELLIMFSRGLPKEDKSFRHRIGAGEKVRRDKKRSRGVYDGLRRF